MATFPALAPDRVVFRVILDKRWINGDGSVRWQAFKRAVRDTDGVSVAFTREDARRPFTRPFGGTTSVIVGEVREIQQESVSLDVVQDEEIHANIVNIPYIHELPEGSEERNRLEDLMTRLCTFLASIAKDTEREPA